MPKKNDRRTGGRNPDTSEERQKKKGERGKGKEVVGYTFGAVVG